MWRLIILSFVLAGPTAAQISNIEAEGNLAPTHQVGCVPLTETASDWSPADLAQGVLACFKAKKDDAAVDLFMLMNVRGVYDQARVADPTAHQGLQVLSMQIGQSAGRGWQPRMQAAFKRFGGTGSERHIAFCRSMRASGPPQHSPRYMIQHGMGAFRKGQGNCLVEGFSAKAEWNRVLDEYLKCVSR